MVRIEAVIRPSRLDEVKAALDDLGIHGISVIEIKGAGKQKGYTQHYRGSEYQVNLLPKAMVIVVVKDEEMDGAVSAIETAGRTVRSAMARSLSRRSWKPCASAPANEAMLPSRNASIVSQWPVVSQRRPAFSLPARYTARMAFRPCIDLKDGRVVQIVGGTLSDNPAHIQVNHVSERSAAEFAKMYCADSLRGGHVIMLGPGNREEALSALRAYPEGLQVGGGITPENASHYLDAGASHVIVTSFLFEDDQLSPERLETMAKAVGKQHLVIDLSCRRMGDGCYYVATNRWQTVTQTRLDQSLIAALESFCAEFLSMRRT